MRGFLGWIQFQASLMQPRKQNNPENKHRQWYPKLGVGQNRLRRGFFHTGSQMQSCLSRKAAPSGAANHKPIRHGPTANADLGPSK
jgi:hypothetical protein